MSLKEPKIINEIDTLEVNIKLKDDGILYVFFKSNITLDVKLQERLLTCYYEITKNKPTPFLFESGDGVVVTREARENAIRIEKQSPCNAMAVVVDNLPYKLIANFYFQFHKPSIPYKVFSDIDVARLWLRNYIVL